MEENRVVALIHRNITSTPHGELGPIVAAMREAIREHPILGAKACVFIFSESKIRDQRDAAVIALIQEGILPGKDPDPLGIRGAGLALMGLDIYKTGNTTGFEALPPHQIFRIWDYLRGYENIRQSYRFKKQQRFRRVRQKQAEHGPHAIRAMGKFMATYLRRLEKNTNRFDKVVSQPGMRQHLKNAYRHHRIQPGSRAKAILFDKKPPPDSADALIKEIKALPEKERARRVIESADRLSFITAASLLPKGDAKNMIALIEVMTPNEARNSVAMVEESGILEIKEVADFFWNKVKEAESIATMTFRKSAQAKTEAGKQAVAEAKEREMERLDKIDTPTLLLLDYSTSMEISYTIALDFGTLIAPRLTNLTTVLFWDSATHVTPKENTIEGWKKALMGYRPRGYTTIGGGLRYGMLKQPETEQVIVVTDGGENRAPFYRDELAKYPELRTLVVAVGNYNRPWSNAIEQAGYPIEVFEYQGDPLIYDNIGLWLAGQGKVSLSQRILEIELPYIIR